MTKAELVKEYNQLWTLTKKELEYIRDTDSYTGDKLYYKFVLDSKDIPELSKRQELYNLGGEGNWRLNRITKTDLEIKIQEITELLTYYSKILKQQLEKM